MRQKLLNMKMILGNNVKMLKEEKIFDLLEKNYGFKILKQILDILSGKEEKISCQKN